MEAISKRIEGLEEFLARQKVDVRREQAHLNEGSREALYWHFGYLIALRDIRRQAESAAGYYKQ